MTSEFYLSSLTTATWEKWEEKHKKSMNLALGKNKKDDEDRKIPHTLLIKSKPPTLEKYPFIHDRIIQTSNIIGTFHESTRTLNEFKDRRPKRPKAEKDRDIIEEKGAFEKGEEEKDDEIDDIEWDPYLENPVEEKGGEEEEDKKFEAKVKEKEVEMKAYKNKEEIQRATKILQKYINRWVAYNQLKKLRKTIAKRRHICEEILFTEKEYVKHLLVSEQVFVKPLKELIGKKKGITQQDYNAIFGNGYASIRNVNQIFLDGLERSLYASGEYQPNAVLSTEIRKIAPYFKMYRQYCTNYKKAIDQWKLLKKNNDVVPIIRRMEQDDRTTKLGLVSYLILPIQRIPRYRLLLRDLIKNTNEEHRDFAGLKSAIGQIVDVADYLDQSMKEMEGAEELKELREKFNIPSLRGFELVSPHRRRLKEGSLKSGLKKENIQEVYLFLFNDILMFTQNKGGSYFYQSHIDLTSAKLYENMTEHKEKFKIISPAFQGVLTCETEKKRSDWLIAILNAINSLKKKRHITEVKDTSKDTLEWAIKMKMDMNDEDCVEYVKECKTIMIMYTPKPVIKYCNVSKNEKKLQWFAENKIESFLKLERVNELVTGQQTSVFKKNKKAEYEGLSFSLLYGSGHRTGTGEWTGKTLDVVCESKELFNIWTRALIFILKDRGKTTAQRNREYYKNRDMKKRKLRKRRLTGDDAFTWGKGEAGCLGHGDNKDAFLPTIIKNFLFLDVDTIACGEACVFATLNDGSVFSWGSGTHGKLAMGDTANYFHPARVQALSDYQIANVSCGVSHTLFLEDNGRIWGAGSNEHGQLGVGETKKKKYLYPSRIRTTMRFKYVAAGMNHSGAISANGKLWTWGDNRDGQLGHGGQKGEWEPKLVETLGKLEVVELAFGHSHSMALTKDNNVWTWGDGTDGQLGNGKHGKGIQALIPVQLKSAFLKKKVKKIACGAFHCGAVTVRGKIYMWGNGIYGQIGNGKKENSVARPTLLTQYIDFPCRTLVCGAMHNICVCEDRQKDGQVKTRVVVWGAGTYGRLGLGSEKDQLAPKEILYFQNKDVKKVAAGGCNSACITSHIWVPDKDIIQCMNCEKKFTFKKRKHHCRNCGGVYCGDCTKKKAQLFQVGLDAVRVCNKCHNIISSRIGSKESN